MIDQKKQDWARARGRPNKEAKGRTYTFERAKRSTGARQGLSSSALNLLVRGTCDKLSWMHTHYYRMRSSGRATCKCCGQSLPKLQKLNGAGRRRLRTMRRRTEMRQLKTLRPVYRPLGWIAWIEEIVHIKGDSYAQD